MKFLQIRSTEHNNSTTDKLEIEIKFDNEKLEEFCFSLNNNRKEFSNYLRDNFPSHDDFSPSIPTDVDKFRKQREVEESTNYSNGCTQVMLEFYLLTVLDFDKISQDIFEYALELSYEMDETPCLTDKQKKLVENFISRVEIDPSELKSSRWDSNPYCVEPPLSIGSGCWMYDEYEMKKAKLYKAYDLISSEGCDAFFSDDEFEYGNNDPREYTKSVLDYMDTL